LLAACLAFPWKATAATLPPAVAAQLAGPRLTQPLLAATTPTVKTVKADYTCDFSAFASGIPAATVSITSEVATSWPVNQPDDVTLANDAITLPSTVTSQLAGVDSIVVASQVTAKNATKATIALSGEALVDATSAPAKIPAITSLGRVTFAAKGSDGSVALPAQSVTFTPMAGTTAKPVITCTTATAAQDAAIIVGDASGPFYHCTTNVTGQTPDESAGPAPLTVAETGTKKTGDSLTISLSSSDVATLISTAQGLVTAAGGTLDKAEFSADLAVTGVQSDTLHITKTVTDLTASAFSASAKLKLTNKGTVQVDLPSRFGLALSASGTDVVTIACTLVTTPAPVALTVTVAEGPTPTPTPSATASDTDSGGGTEDSGATTEATGTPVGGAATGGGVMPGGGAPLALLGAALALTGGGLLLARVTVPRRGKARRGMARPGRMLPGQAGPEAPSAER
jgi:hypothetical protein